MHGFEPNLNPEILKCWQVNGITLVAMSLHQSLLGILSVEWMMQNPKPSQHESAVGNSNVPFLAPRIFVRFLALPQPNSTTHPMVAFTHHFVIHGLAFLGAHGSHGYGALDLKMRPLLVLLASQLGKNILNYEGLSRSLFKLTAVYLSGVWFCA